MASPSLERRVAAASAGLDGRRRRLLERAAWRHADADEIARTDTDAFSNRAIANLALGRHVAAANARLRRTAEWFDHPNTLTQWGPRGESTFAAIKLVQAWLRFHRRGLIEPATVSHMQRFFLEFDFESMHDSENHHLMFRTARHLIGGAWPEAKFGAYGRRGAALAQRDARWLESFIRFRARRGWGEFDSCCYMQPDFECLTLLHEFASDATVRHLATQMLNLLLADMIADSRPGVYGGAMGRIYAHHAVDHSIAFTYLLQYLYFAEPEPEPAALDRLETETDFARFNVSPLLSSFTPHPVIVALALDREQAYVNRERKHLHNLRDVRPRKPLAGSIRTYTHVHPRYVLGCIQHKDPYAPGAKGGHYANHGQHQWDLSFVGSPRARLFTHYRASDNAKTYWTCDPALGGGRFFQHRGVLLASYDVGDDQPIDFIHALLPRAEFDEVVEHDNWVFVRFGEAYAGLCLPNGYSWTRSGEWADRELISPGRSNAAVCEAAAADQVGAFDAFRQQVLSNPLAFDARRKTLRYRSARAGDMLLTPAARTLDGRPIDLDYPTWDNPWMHSAWDSGVVDIAVADQSLRLDFSDANSFSPV